MALKKLDESLIEEHDAGVEGKEFEDMQLQNPNAEEKSEIIIIKHDAGVEEKAPIKDNNDDEKQSITEEDGKAIVAAEQNGIAATTEPVPLPCTTK